LKSPSLASTTSSVVRSCWLSERKMGSSFLHTGQVGDRKNSSWLRPVAAPTTTSPPPSEGNVNTGDASPTLGP
jgi:hypothetical protein